MATISQPDVVAGTERFKYFRRPMLAAPDPVIIKQGAVAPPPPVPPPVEVPRSRTVGTQSDYRENDTQTIPWEPDVVLPENPSVKQQALSAKYNCSGPELLTLKDLKFGEGLPPGLQEVRRIEKMREKRAFEASLPPLHDVEKLPIRQKMIEEWEKMEWEDREDEILGVQDERLALLEQALIAREGDVDDVTARRVEDRKTALLQERADKFASLQAGRIKTMRHLSEARKYVEKPRKLHKLSVIEKYADFGSSAYAPMQREGKVTQRQNIETEGFQPVSLQGLDELEAYLPSRLLNPIIGVPQKPLKLDYQQRKEAGIQNDLKVVVNHLNFISTSSQLLHPLGSYALGPHDEHAEEESHDASGCRVLGDRGEVDLLLASLRLLVAGSCLLLLLLVIIIMTSRLVRKETSPDLYHVRCGLHVSSFGDEASR